MKRGKFHLYLVYLVLATSAVTCVSFSRYSTSVCGTATATVAKPICVLSESSITTQAADPNQETGEECYFEVSNFDEQGLTETAMTYTLYIKPTVKSATSVDETAVETMPILDMQYEFTLQKEDSSGSWITLADNSTASGPGGETGWYAYDGGDFGIDSQETDRYKIVANAVDGVGNLDVQFEVKVIAEQIQPK